MSSQVLLGCVLLGLSYLVPSQQQTPPSPIRIPPGIFQSSDLTCPSLNFSAHRELLQQSVEDYYRVLPCSCGGARGWTRAAYLNMSDMNQQCPSAWTPNNTPVRGCSRKNGGYEACDSVTYPVHGLTYSRVCGRVLAYRRGYTSGFLPSISRSHNTVEDAYLSGVSLTHGSPGSRRHIWSFAAALFDYNGVSDEICPCSTTSFTYQLPSFLNNSYFCEAGDSGGWDSSHFYTHDLLWDGQRCGSSSTCCQFNNPPWFCTSLPQPTNEDLEIRSCFADPSFNENIIIKLIEIYVK